MENLYPFSEFNFEAVVEDKHSSSNNEFWNSSSYPLDQHHHNEVLENVTISQAEDWGDSGGLDSFCSINNIGFYPDYYYSSQEDCLLSFSNQHKEPLSNLDYGSLDNLPFDMVVSSPLGDAAKFDDQIAAKADLSRSYKDYQNQNFPLPLASLDLLNNYGNGLKCLYGEIEPDDVHQVRRIDDLRGRKKLSAEEVMRIAATMFIRSSSSDQSEGLDSLIPHPYDCYYYNLSEQEKDDVKLAESLLACAEKVGLANSNEQPTFLTTANHSLRRLGTLKRVVSYFCEALRERINRETGRPYCTPPFSPVGEIPCHYHKYREKEFSLFDVDKSMQNPGPTMLACQVQLPFSQMTKFAGIQAMLEKLINSKKIHIIDLEIREGSQWTILMQALALRRECPLELLKITAVGTAPKDTLEETGKRLTNFAESLNISFSFNIVTVSNMNELKEELFKRDGEETIAVYAMFALRPLIVDSDQLEAIMKVIRNLNPIVMVVTEVEANHNSKSFVKRFTEALFYFSAFFDCVEESMEGDDPNRRVLESLYLRFGIRDIVAMEGKKRKMRNVKIEVWRAFLGRFGMVEEELSMSSLYQAELVAKKFFGGNSCTFHMDGSSLLTGWKGTPLSSLSAQDYLFVRAFVPFVASVLIKAWKESDEGSDMEVILKGMASLEDEISWFKREASKWDVPHSDVAPQQANINYCRFLEKLMGPEKKYTEVITAFWAIEAVYQESFAHILEEGSKAPPELNETCERWGNEGFGQYCQSLLKIATRRLQRASDDQLKTYELALLTVLELEVEFWNMSRVNA